MSPDEDRTPAEAGRPGASTAREHERRRAARVHKVLMHHPFADKDDVATRPGPAHERAFAVGSDGERWVARTLDKRLAPGAVALHDRAIPQRRGNIDHIVVAASGVWVVDAKRYSGRLAVWQPAEGRGMLAIAGRDRTHLVDGLARQVETVASFFSALGASPPVHGALCFVETDLPQGRRLTFEGWHVVDPRQLARRIDVAAARLDSHAVRALADEIARHFPPA
jgi:hypothetical protein